MNKKNLHSSLVIATYNWPAALELLFLSLLNQKKVPSEILVADDGSLPETGYLVQSYKKKFTVPVKHIWHEDKGFRKTTILNKAITACSNNYIIQVDGDVILDDHFVIDHLRMAEPNTFVRGTRAHLTPLATKLAIEKKRVCFHCWSKGVKHRNNAFRSEIFSALGIRRQMCSKSVRGSNLAFWKEDFIKVNGYNNDLCGWGHEDEELAARFINNGIIKKKVKLACIQYHLHHAATSTIDEPQHRQVINNVIEKKKLQCVNGIMQLNKKYA